MRESNDRRLDGARVVIVNNFPGPGMGGAEMQLLPVVEALLAAGAELSVIVVPESGFGARCAAMGTRVVETPMTSISSYAAVATIRREIRASGSSSGRALVLGSGFFTNLLVRLAAWGDEAAVVNLVTVVPGASLLDGGSAVGAVARRIVERTTRHRVDGFVAVSEAVRRALLSSGVSPDTVQVVLNGVDTHALGALSDASSGVPHEGPLIVCVARLEAVKGVEHLVRAAELLGTDVTVAIVGVGSQESRLRELAQARQSGAVVRFLGAVGSAAEWMARADIVVVPSLSEAFGLVAAEAMALGRPVVASAVGGLPEVVVDGVTGVLVPPADPHALAAAVNDLLANPTRASDFGHAGRIRAGERFDSGRMTSEYLRILGDLTERDCHVRRHK